MTGHPEFERAVRVQMNTLEWLPIFLPLLWLATLYFSPAMSTRYLSWLPAVLGVIWIIGRYLYMNGLYGGAGEAQPGLRHRRPGRDRAPDMFHRRHRPAAFGRVGGLMARRLIIGAQSETPRR